jgi:hypothetical protein
MEYVAIWWGSSGQANQNKSVQLEHSAGPTGLLVAMQMVAAVEFCPATRVQRPAAGYPLSRNTKIAPSIFIELFRGCKFLHTSGLNP